MAKVQWDEPTLDVCARTEGFVFFWSNDCTYFCYSKLLVVTGLADWIEKMGEAVICKKKNVLPSIMLGYTLNIVKGLSE